MPGVPHFTNLPLASLQRLEAAAGGGHLTNLPLASLQGPLDAGAATGGGHFMNLPFASLHGAAKAGGCEQRQSGSDSKQT